MEANYKTAFHYNPSDFGESPTVSHLGLNHEKELKPHDYVLMKYSVIITHA